MTEWRKSADVVTWQQAEDAMLAAIEYLARSPDADARFLHAGSRSAWPEIVRSARDGDYGDGQGFGAEATPSVRLSRRMAGHVELMLTAADAVALVVPEGHRALVGCVLLSRLRDDVFDWADIWRRQRGVLFNLRRGEALPATSDAMRKAYDRAIGKVALAMEKRGIGATADAA